MAPGSGRVPARPARCGSLCPGVLGWAGLGWAELGAAGRPSSLLAGCPPPPAPSCCGSPARGGGERRSALRVTRPGNTFLPAAVKRAGEASAARRAGTGEPRLRRGSVPASLPLPSVPPASALFGGVCQRPGRRAPALQPPGWAGGCVGTGLGLPRGLFAPAGAERLSEPGPFADVFSCSAPCLVPSEEAAGNLGKGGSPAPLAGSCFQKQWKSLSD